MFTVMPGILILLAIVLAFFCVRMLANTSWFLGWLRGTLGLCLAVFAVLFVFVGLDLTSYEKILTDKPVLTVSFTKQEDQRYIGTVVSIEEGGEEQYEIYGDQWQIDARVIRWRGMFQTFGMKPGYRLDRITGRYYSLEEERRKPRSVHQLTQSEYGLDMWRWVQENGRLMPIFDAVYGSATYLPMADGAIYQVSLSASGLVAKPLNRVAEQAVNQWQ